MKTAIELITQERNEQLGKHNYSHDHDILNNCAGELPTAAEMLLASTHEEGIDPESYPTGWNHDMCTNMLAKPYLERLVVAAALIVAEIERVQNTESDSIHARILQNAKDNEFVAYSKLVYIQVNDISDLDRVSMLCTENFRHDWLQTREGRAKLTIAISQRRHFAFMMHNGVLEWAFGSTGTDKQSLI